MTRNGISLRRQLTRRVLRLVAANLVFGPFYRPPTVYRGWMEAAGLRPLPPLSARLDMTFHVTAAEKPA